MFPSNVLKNVAYASAFVDAHMPIKRLRSSEWPVTVLGYSSENDHAPI